MFMRKLFTPEQYRHRLFEEVIDVGLKCLGTVSASLRDKVYNVRIETYLPSIKSLIDILLARRCSPFEVLSQKFETMDCHADQDVE